MDTPDDQSIAPPPEAVLIRTARKARGLTITEAANVAGIVKASRWGQIENGHLMKGGVAVPTRAPDMQLAHMARSVGVTSSHLKAAGREDAAEILREMERQEAGASPGEGMNAGEMAAVRQMDALLAAMQEAARRAAREEVAADLSELQERIARLEEQFRKEIS